MLLCNLKIQQIFLFLFTVYRVLGVSFKMIIEMFTNFVQDKKLRFDRILLFGWCNFPMIVNNDASRSRLFLWKNFV